MPRFSIIVPAYNAAATLPETLDAIMAQTFTGWECIVVDDGSTDDTLAIARSAAADERRLRVLTQPNQGTAGAYNTGVRDAAGEFVVLCSADDLLLPEHLAAMSAFIDSQRGYDIYSSNGYYLSSGGQRMVVYQGEDRASVLSLSLADVIRDCFYSVGAVYRRELFDRVGGYRVGVFGEDYDFWLRAMASGARHRYTPEMLSVHRLSATQKSAGHENAFRSDIRLLEDLRRHHRLTRAEREAVRATIDYRRRLIADPSAVPSPRRSVRDALVDLAAHLTKRTRSDRRQF